MDKRLELDEEDLRIVNWLAVKYRRSNLRLRDFEDNYQELVLAALQRKADGVPYVFTGIKWNYFKNIRPTDWSATTLKRRGDVVPMSRVAASKEGDNFVQNKLAESRDGERAFELTDARIDAEIYKEAIRRVANERRAEITLSYFELCGCGKKYVENFCNRFGVSRQRVFEIISDTLKRARSVVKNGEIDEFAAEYFRENPNLIKRRRKVEAIRDDFVRWAKNGVPSFITGIGDVASDYKECKETISSIVGELKKKDAVFKEASDKVYAEWARRRRKFRKEQKELNEVLNENHLAVAPER